MTAEIVVMNREAVALAADSAVTIQKGRDEKVITSANKIFTLSRKCPVGVMMFGGANHMGVPWETVVSLYQERLGAGCFDTLEEYADDFMGFLSGEMRLYPESEQRDYFAATVTDCFVLVKNVLRDAVNSLVEENPAATDEQKREAANKAFRAILKVWDKAEELPGTPADLPERLEGEYGKVIREIRRKVFRRWPASPSYSGRLNRLALDIFIKSPSAPQFGTLSGVVVAGFGEKDIFPTVVEFLVGGVVCDHLRFKKDRVSGTGSGTRAAVIPFARREMVNAFMEGAEPAYNDTVFNRYGVALDAYRELVEGLIGELKDAGDKEDYRKRADSIRKGAAEIPRELAAFRRKKYVIPVIDVIAGLPKNELSEIAESLVNLTSFRTRMSFAAESVGGPIDVAVITRSDGFVWIKHKHYFAPELNPQFFINYFSEGRDRG
ncbi:MAG: hypothetical protein KKF41_16365 [Actinobacteria bacterium]|nr:hypothetical protein [Actinomycetota bacterium]MBU1944602.1 hypothetical protein [Actinomycetota bacterium]MBU2689155.1 hypothetical protein [Actinomycetota bacterium]